jgi:hypothetical protein
MPQRLEDTKNHEEINISESTERTAKLIVDAAFTVHVNLGPGLLEKVYVKR